MAGGVAAVGVEVAADPQAAGPARCEEDLEVE
jgi:hypothetical protein